MARSIKWKSCALAALLFGGLTVWVTAQLSAGKGPGRRHWPEAVSLAGVRSAGLSMVSSHDRLLYLRHYPEGYVVLEESSGLDLAPSPSHSFEQLPEAIQGLRPERVEVRGSDLWIVCDPYGLSGFVVTRDDSPPIECPGARRLEEGVWAVQPARDHAPGED